MKEKNVEKRMAADIQERYGALVSISNLRDYTGSSWAHIAGKLVDCKTFGEGKHKKYFYLDATEAICRNS